LGVGFMRLITSVVNDYFYILVENCMDWWKINDDDDDDDDGPTA
jgi:hypothetical protein